jgi:hypothetical protein
VGRPPTVRNDASPRFQGEVRALSQLQHPYIVEIYEFGLSATAGRSWSWST